MAKIETWFNQDLKQAVKVRYLDGNVFSADNAGNLVGVNVYDDGEPASLSGTVSGKVIRADGTTVAVTGTLSGNTAYIVLPQAAYVIPGVISIVIKLTSGTDITTLCAVVSNVYQSTTDTVVDPGTIIPSIETIIAEIEAAVASIPADYSALWTSLAPAFSSSTSYVAGQYVTYNGGLYKFTNSHSGSWVSGDVTSVNLGNEVTDLKSAINTEVGFNLFDKTKIVPNTTYTSNGEIASVSDGRYTILIPVDSTNNLRVRSNQRPVYINVFDSSMQQVGDRTSYYAASISGCSYAGFTFNDSTSNDKDTIMVAYTQETSGAASDRWKNVFPDCPDYVPYKVVVDKKNIQVGNYSKTLNSYMEKEETLKNALCEVFNLFDKTTVISNHVYKTDGTLDSDSSYDCTPMIPVDSTNNLRVRCNQQIFRFCTYNVHGEFIEYTTSIRYASSISGAAYVTLSFQHSGGNDYNTLMMAYTQETSGAVQNKWDELFPGSLYTPYGERIKANAVFYRNGNIENTLDRLIDLTAGNIPYTLILEKMTGVTGVSITTDQYTGQKIINIAGSSSSATWKTIKAKCEPLKCYCLEFMGKAGTDAPYPYGSLFRIKFYDNSGNVIGTSYDAYVLGVNRLGYHRYGFVSPIGSATMGLDFITRANSSMSVTDLTVTKADPCPQRKMKGLQFKGHLGMIMVAPKNTMPAFELGKISGFSTMVTNINVTQDGELVALHDDTIDATSNGTGNVRDFTYAQLQSYDFGSWFSPVYTGTKIPKFEEVVRFLAGSGIKVAVSLHHNMSETELNEMSDILKKYCNGGVVIISGYYQDLNLIKAYHEQIGLEAEYVWAASPTTTATIDEAKQRGYIIEVNGDASSLPSVIAYAVSQHVPLSRFVTDMATIKQSYKMGITRFTVDSFSDIVIPMDGAEPVVS